MNSTGTAAGADISAALRELLLLRAAGKLSADEFDMRQAGLHALLLTAPAEERPAPEASPPPSPIPAMATTESVSVAPTEHGVRVRAFPRKLLIVAVVSVACFAVALYFLVGNSGNVSVVSAPPPAKEAGASPATAQPPQGKAGGDLTIMVKRLADKMAADPKNGEGWLLLARTYGELQMPRESADAYAKAAALLPADAALLADWAAVSVATNGGKWDDPSRDILKRALATDSKHMKTLALAGLEAFERADRGKAIEYWERLKKVAPPDSPDAKMADAKLAEARAGEGGKGGKGAAGSEGAAKSSPAKKSAP